LLCLGERPENASLDDGCRDTLFDGASIVIFVTPAAAADEEDVEAIGFSDAAAAGSSESDGGFETTTAAALSIARDERQ
jgi:hypothetical protein